jgi:hypothetical protein
MDATSPDQERVLKTFSRLGIPRAQFLDRRSLRRWAEPRWWYLYLFAAPPLAFRRAGIGGRWRRRRLLRHGHVLSRAGRAATAAEAWRRLSLGSTAAKKHIWNSTAFYKLQ